MRHFRTANTLKAPLFTLFPVWLMVSLLISWESNAQPITSTGIDTVVRNALKAFNVPGMAIGVIKDGKLIHAKGYGVRSLNSGLPVDENTIFGIASNSKAMAAATLGILVDEGKITWNTRVRDIIPEFMLYDAYVTEQFTIKDLLTHRSGLGLGAGDLMFFPDSNHFTVPQIIHNLRFLKPVSSFRTQYDYNNNFYIVAGEVVARVSGMPWTEFVEQRIFKPLGMNKTASLFSRLPDKSNVIDGHCPVDGVVKVIPRNTCSLWPAAAGVNSNITDLSKWVISMLNKGKFGEGLKDTLLSDAVWNEMTYPQMITPDRGPGPYNTHYYAYGLGLGITDVKGYEQLMHTGGLEGMVTQITMIPELQLGIIVLTNQQEGGAFASVTNQIKDSYLGISGTDRVKEISERRNIAWAKADSVMAEVWTTVNASLKSRKGTSDWTPFLGTYNDSWMGDWMVSVKNGKLWLDSKMSPRLTGELFFYKGNTYVVKWSDRSFDADAFVMFSLDKNGKANGFTMEAISPMTDFSYDFHDMDLKRKN